MRALADILVQDLNHGDPGPQASEARISTLKSKYLVQSKSPACLRCLRATLDIGRGAMDSMLD